MTDTPIKTMRDRARKAITGEALAIYQEAFPTIKDPVAAQAFTATVLIQMEKSCPYHSYNFEGAETATEAPEKQTPATENKPNEQVKSGNASVDFPIGPTEKAKELEKAAAYDPIKKKWNVCPTCGSTDINHTKKDNPHAVYQACFKDEIYLNFDGTIRPRAKENGPKRI